MSSKRQSIEAAARRDPKPTASDLCAEFGVTRQYVSLVIRAAGIKLGSGRKRVAVGSRAWTSHFGLKTALPSGFVGATGEFVAAAQLMQIGVPVFRALAPVGPFDLIAVVDGRLLRVEVRCARRTKTGIHCGRPKVDQAYDVLAMVEPNGDVTWSPKRGVKWIGEGDKPRRPEISNPKT